MAAEMDSMKVLKGAVSASCINRNTIRAAAILETTSSGQIVSKVVDVRDVEDRKVECPEVLLMDEKTEQEILHELRKYANTQRYVAVMITIMLIIYVLDSLVG